MLEEISSRQFNEWAAFAKLEPFGYLANMHGPAVVAATVANASGSKKRYKPADFLPKEDDETLRNTDIFGTLKRMLVNRFKKR